jgi:hypothetical protein
MTEEQLDDLEYLVQVICFTGVQFTYPAFRRGVEGIAKKYGIDTNYMVSGSWSCERDTVRPSYLKERLSVKSNM